MGARVGARRCIDVCLAVVVGAALLAPGAGAKGGPEIVEKEDGKYLHLCYEEDAASQAWLYRPVVDADATAPPKGYDLIVALHGARGNPKNFVMSHLMDARGSWCLAVAGHQSVQTERGQGYMWDGRNAEYVVAFVEHLLAKYPIDKDRVVVWGHSAGGSMTLHTLAKAPQLFAGGLTTAAPGTPDSRHKEKRICVFLGTEDPNWAGAGSVRAFLKGLLKKRAKGACAFFAVQELGHDVPYDDYLGLGFEWILHGTARGGEASVPRRSRGEEGDYHHILVRFKGAENAEGVKRTKSKAQKLLKSIKKELDKDRAFFRFEAACHSEEPETASCGGGIDADDLTSLLGALPDLKPGEVSEILPSAQGLHLVYRPVPDPDDAEDD